MKNIIGLLLAVILLLSGCSAGKPPSPPKATGDVPCQPPKSLQVEAEPTFAALEGGGLRAEPKARFVATREIASGNLDISERYVVWSGGDTRKSTGQWLCLFDLETWNQRKVAELRPQWREKGIIERVGVSGDIVIYTEIAQLRSDLFAPSAWATIAVDLKTGKKKELAARTASKDLEGRPAFAIEWPWVILGGLFPDDINRHKGVKDFRNLVAVDLRSGARSVLVEKVDTEFFGISDGLVAYDVYTEKGKEWCLNIFVVPVGRSDPPKQATTSCGIQWPQIDSGMVAWQEVVEVEAKGYPMKVSKIIPWTQILGRAEPPIRLAEYGSNVHPGKGFAVWLGQLPGSNISGLLAKNPLSAEPPLLLSEHPSPGTRWRTHRDLVVWTTKNRSTTYGAKSNAYVVHVARIVKT